MKLDVRNIINDIPFQKKDSMYHSLMFKLRTKVYWRTRMAESQNWKCCFCGVCMTEVKDYKHSVTLEHVLPLSLGGADSKENYAASCARCNNRRGSNYVFDLSELKFQKCDPSVKNQAAYRKYFRRHSKLFPGDTVSDAFKTWFASIKATPAFKSGYFQYYEEQMLCQN